MMTRSIQAIAACVLLTASLSLTAAATTDDDPPVPGFNLPCYTATSSDCGVSSAEMKQARDLFQRGIHLKSAGRGDEALDSFERASQLVPRNVEFASAREITRQALIYEHVRRGNNFLDEARKVEAMAEFRAALELDPQNEFALQRLHDSFDLSPAPISPGIQRVMDSAPIVIQPKPGTHDFHFRGDTRSLMTEVTGAFGIAATVDDSVTVRPVRFDLQQADYYTAIAAAQSVTKSFLVPLERNAVMVVADTQLNHQQLEEMSLQTFYLPSASSQADLNEMVNALRSLLDIRYVALSAANGLITVRAPTSTLAAAERLLTGLQNGPPQVLLDVKVFQVSRNALRNLGIGLPTQFQMFNLTSAALAAAVAGLGGGNNQDLINQLISGGGINQANSQGIQALLAQLQSQQNSILNTPFATFGGGVTRFGVGIPPATANFHLNQSDVRTLEHLTLRASQGNAASFHVGSRFPILNAIFSPIFNTPAIASVIQNNSFQAPFPSFSYEDLGITLKATPTIHGDQDVGLKLELQFRNLSGTSINGIPILTDREYQGSITVKNGEVAVVVGTISRTEQRSLSGVPGLGNIPGVDRLVTGENKEHDEDELLVTITPHVVSVPGAAPTLQVLRR